MKNLLRLTVRCMFNSPGFALTAILTLALGIGLSTSSFTFVNTFVLRGLPYHDSERLVRVIATSPTAGFNMISPANADDLLEAVSSFEQHALYRPDSWTMADPGQPAQPASGTSVSPGFFDMLGVKAALGRTFVPDEDHPAKSAVVVLRHHTWTTRYNGDPQIIGRTIRLNAKPYTVIGVLPKSFEAPVVWGTVDFWVPLSLDAAARANRLNGLVFLAGRLKPGASLRQAQEEFAVLGKRLEQEYPKENVNLVYRVSPLRDTSGGTSQLTWMLTGVSLTLLVIACANLATLQVARAFARRREYAIRAALGGGRRQLMAPLLAESLGLSILGGAGALLVALWANGILARYIGVADVPGLEFNIDSTVFLFCAACALTSGVAFGVVPALLASRVSAGDALKDSGRANTGGKSHQRIKNALVVVELALACTLVGTAASFAIGVKSFLERPVGWDYDRVLLTGVVPPATTYADNDRLRQFFREAVERISALPGVEHAAFATSVPLYSFGGAQHVSLEGQQLPAPGQEHVAEFNHVTPDYFNLMKIRVQRGSTFRPGLSASDPAAAVVSESFAQRFWPKQDPVGRRLKIEGAGPWIEVIGVVNDVEMPLRMDSPGSRMQVYIPMEQSPIRYVAVVVKTSVLPQALSKSVRDVFSSLDPDLPTSPLAAVQDVISNNKGGVDLTILNVSVSAAMGLLISAIGLFGVMSQLTHQRTRDIGIRMALGARAADILLLILRPGAGLLALGLALGVGGMFALNRVLHQSIREVQSPGVWLLAITVVAIAITMLVACFLPARRATRVDPVEALRAE